MFKKVITPKDSEFIIRLEEESIDCDDDEQPQTYVYCHIENRFGGSLDWLSTDDTKEIRDNLSIAIAIAEKKNKVLGWKE